MARGSRISIWGLYQADPTLFSGMVLPSDLNVNVFVDNLLMQYAELEVLYPDADFMKGAIAIWSSMRLPTWNRMQTVLYEDYDPFINIKRDEVRTITEERDLLNSGTQNSTNRLTGTDTVETADSRQTSGTTTGKVSAWNETSYSDRDQQVTSGSENGSADQTSTLSHQTTGTATDQTASTGTITTTEHFHVEGDSAITDAQDVLKKEMDVRIRYDLYQIILDEFKRRFCLLVY